MSKKDKRKKHDAKDDAGSTASAWMADLRAPRSGVSSSPASAASSSSLASPAERGDDDLLDTRIPPLRPVTVEAIPGGDDLGEETLADLAPVGPTELAMSPESTRTPTPAARASDAEEALRPPASMEQLEQQIRDLEARLDEMIEHGASEAAASGGAGATVPSPGNRAPLGTPTTNPSVTTGEAPAPAISVTRPSSPQSEARATARDLLPADFYLRQWGRAGRRQRAEEVDEFGHDPKYEARFLWFFDFLYKTYFRVDAEGVENIPAAGRCLVVSNHSGGPLPYDGIMLRTTVRREHAGAEGPRELRWLAEDFVYYLPFVGTAMNRLGAVRACQENAERLLAGGHLVAVFPEGAKGIGKLFRERYRLQRFGRGGFIRLCLRTQTPIVPAAIVGAEEANPMLYRLEYMTKTLGIPYLPITPTFPALGPLGLLPAPTKWKVVFGEPLDFGAYGPEAADDDLLVGRLAERVRATIQSMLDQTLAGRRSIWFG